MSSVIRTRRLLVDGAPASGLSSWGPVADEVVEGDDPKERSHYVYDKPRPSGGVCRAGVWEASPYKCRLDNYKCDEFCVVLEGSVTMIEEDGREETYRAGDTFLIPKGFTGFWKQTETMKKFFVTTCYT